MGTSMECSGLTNIGLQRTNNEDQFLIADICTSIGIHQASLAFDHKTRLFGEPHGKMLLVADGMGGHEAGERASALVTDGIVDYILNRLTCFPVDAFESEKAFQLQLMDAVQSCQTRIDRETTQVPQHSGMGSTLTLAYIIWPELFLVHVGDSRCYLLRNGLLQQLTRDHTLANLGNYRRNDLRVLSPEDDSDDIWEEDDFEATSNSALSNVLWNAIGGNSGSSPNPDTRVLELRVGDKLLLCTDGLSNMLSRQQIKELLEQELTTAAICSSLVEAANAAGGHDNISVVVSRFVERVEKAKAEEIVLSLDEPLADTVDLEENADSAEKSEI